MKLDFCSTLATHAQKEHRLLKEIHLHDPSFIATFRWLPKV
jgi:hypothetical protein